MIFTQPPYRYNMNKAILTIFCSILCATINYSAIAQEYNPIPVALPSLQIAPDARGGGMGDIGAATMPDVYSHHWNAAKYPFVSGDAGIAFSYTPWLSKLVSDIHLLYTSGYWKFGNDNLNAISASLRYFSLGDIEVGSLNDEFWQTVSPHEFALDVGYSRTVSYTHLHHSLGTLEGTRRPFLRRIQRQREIECLKGVLEYPWRSELL